MSAQRLRRWPNSKTLLFQRVVFAVEGIMVGRRRKRRANLNRH